MSSPAPLTPSIVLKLIATCAFWGGAFIAGRHIAQQMPHFTAATGRFLFAAIPLLLYAHLRGELTLPSRRQLLGTALMGATGVFLYNLFFFGGLAYLPAGRGALIVALSPVLTLLTVKAIARTPLVMREVAGVLLSLSGAAVVITRGDLGSALAHAVGRGELLMFLAIVAWVAYTVITRYAVRGMSAIAATAWSTLWGTLMLAAAVPFELAGGVQVAPDLLSWVGMAYMGLCGTALAFVWYTEGVQAIGPARTVLFTNLVPVFAVLFSVVLLGEPLLISALVGGLMVVSGVTLANFQRSR
jgi:drug/metabolite transporter (DMT)-like permease